jgi:hypothetical protein
MPKDKEHFIPVGREKLLECLTEFETCSESEKSELKKFFELISSVLHKQYHKRQIRVQKIYQPLDPDSVILLKDSDTKNSSEVFTELIEILANANYTKLSTDELETAVDNATALGLRMKVDFSLFDELHVYGRGDEIQTWTKKSWWKFFKEEKFDVEVYQRLVIAFRLKDHDKLPKEQSSSFVYLKSFKGIPHSDLHTLLPGTQIKMSLLDRGKIIIPALSGIVLSIVKIARLMVAVTIFASLAYTIKFWVIPAAIIYYIIKGFLSYQKTKDKYQLNLTRHLYFQNLNNNSGVLLRLLHEAEFQDYREMVITYYLVWKYGQAGINAEKIHEIAEKKLKETIHLDINFEAEDALAKLEKLGALKKVDQNWVPLPMEEIADEIKNREGIN